MTDQTKDMIEKTLEFYAGPMNCAQAVAAAFQDVSGLTPAQIDGHRHNGGGRAPGGLCGALYAGLEALTDEGQRRAVTERFAAITGSTQCREIRGAKTISCAVCVETAATVVAEALAAADGPKVAGAQE